jgi:DNA-directed RNA polymerase specialized sigma24 family protein
VTRIHDDEFSRFVEKTEPRLRRALVAAYGSERGREATAEALAYAWEYWEAMQEIDNQLAYLYRVGQSRTRLSAELR